MRRALPILGRLRAKLGGNRAAFSCSSETLELAPASRRRQPAAIALADELERVIAVQEETTPEIEFGRLSNGERHHAATTAYRLDNAVLGQGTLYFSGGYEVIRRGAGYVLPPHPDHFFEMQLCSDYVIERYFGHWLTDGIALELLAAERRMPGLKINAAAWLHEPGYRKLCSLAVTRSEYALVDRLWVVDDRGLNDNWIARFQELRSRCRSVVKPTGAKLLMLARGNLGATRSLVNREEVYESLDQIGFELVNPESESPGDIAAKLCGAEIVIAVEGSAQNHCWVAMPIGSTFIAIQPPMRFNAHGKNRADSIGINWGYVVADPHPAGFSLPVDRLLRTIDEVGRVTAMRT